MALLKIVPCLPVVAADGFVIVIMVSLDSDGGFGGWLSVVKSPRCACERDDSSFCKRQ